MRDCELESEKILKKKGRGSFDFKVDANVTVERPFMISEYNQNVGGVDKFDTLMAFYRIDRRNKNYYMRRTGHCSSHASTVGYCTRDI